jgi:chromate transporter
MNSLKLYGAIAAVFSFLSIQAVGGGPAVLPEMQRSVIANLHLSPEQFVQAYGLGQLVPGPNMLLVVVLGYRVAGVVGALIALFAFFIPMSIVVVLVGRYLVKLPPSPWKQAVRDGLAPVTIGLMGSGAYAMGRSATTTLPTLLIGGAVVALMLVTKINPIWLVLASALAGAFVLPH